MGKYDEGTVVRVLNKVSGVSVDTTNKIVNVSKYNSAGNGTWG
jgi:hypothetical protein